MPEKIRDRLDRLITAMKAEREPWEEDWRQCELLCTAQRSPNISATNKRRRGRYNRALNDGYGTYAASVCSNGLSSGLASESQKWFKLKTIDDALMERGDVKDTLGECERRMYAQFAASGFYFASKAGFNDLTKFGIEAGLLEVNASTGEIYSSPLACGTYWITVDFRGQVNRLYRCLQMTLEQAVKDYPSAKWSPQVDAKIKKRDLHEVVTIHIMIEPNDAADPAKRGRRNMPWRSLAWEEGQPDKDVFLKDGGYQERPFWCVRWEVEGNDTYPTTWPALNALPDLRELQAQRKQAGDASDLIVRPPLGVSGNTKVNLNAGAVTAITATEQAMWPKPLWEVQYGVKQAIDADIMASKQNIDRHFYVDRFLPITSMQGVQPRVTQEINLRNQEAIAQLGAPVSRINWEKFNTVIDRMFAVMLRLGMFPEFPEELQGQDLKIEYVSGLAQMLRLSDLDAIERLAQFVGYLTGANPKVQDKFDADQAVDEFAAGAGVPPGVVRGDDAVDAIREARAGAEQQQQMAAQLPAAVDAAKAGQLMSQTDVGGRSLLQALGGQ